MVVPSLGGGGTKVWSQGVFHLFATQDGPLGAEKWRERKEERKQNGVKTINEHTSENNKIIIIYRNEKITFEY